jgi:alpha-L-fucosidase
MTMPTPAQSAWLDLHYGLFISYGPNTFQGVGWGDGSFPAEQIRLCDADEDQWAGVAAEAGMQYAVLTAKHHDGFCLWPSRHTTYAAHHTPGRPDTIARFVAACSKAGIRPGLYYSHWDRHCPCYADDAAYARYMRDQISELLTNYGPIVQIWFDGGWDKGYPTRSWEFDRRWLDDPASGYTAGTRWEWTALYEHIHRLQPDCIVLNNSSSDRPGEPRCMPVDARTSEHLDFTLRGKSFPTDTRTQWTDPRGRTVCLPLEVDACLNADWFYTDRWFAHPSAVTIHDWYRRARAMDGNLLLNVGPTPLGSVPECHIPFLKGAARLIAEGHS